ncbi:MAG: shikimate dehydrogenase [Bacteroidetes bacterium]|nr:shikimate dehydrogenase [Bacteroidota bacterium]
MRKSIKTHARLVGIVGHPILHSWSPIIHETAFKFTNQNFEYAVFDVFPKNLRDAMKGLLALGIVGCNVTVPHKEAVIEFLDEVSADARLVGAVNTIYVENEMLVGHNTDVDGVLEALKPYKEQIANQSVTVFGAGGGARAVVYTLISYFKPEQIYVINRDTSRSELLKKFFADSQNYTNIKIDELHNLNESDVLAKSKLVVNATPVGMFPEINESIMLDDSTDLEGKIFFDLVYNPVLTQFLRTARRRNATIVSGLEMLYHQAARAFELWTGTAMPLEKVREKLDRKFLEESSSKTRKTRVKGTAAAAQQL